MSFRITSSVDTYQSSRQIRVADTRFGASAERIASGTRINRGGDDAAGLAISQRFRSQALGGIQARRNAQAAISMVQTADGALQRVHDTLHRMRELSTRAASDGLTHVERGALAVELQAAGRLIDDLGDQTLFNGHRLFSTLSTPTTPPPPPSTLDATSELQVGITISAGNGGGLRTATVTAIDVTAAQAGTTYTLGQGGGNITLTRGSDGVVDTFVPSTIPASGTATVTFATLGVSITLTSSTGMNTSRLRDALSDPANDAIVTAPGAPTPPPPTADGPVINIGPRATDTVTVAREAVSLQELGLDSALAQFQASLSRDDAAGLADLVDGAVAAVSAKRARLGALQNRLQHATAYLDESEIQLAQSTSRLADTDLAAEAVALTRSSLSRQMAAGIVAQAQLNSGRVLSLLTGAT